MLNPRLLRPLTLRSWLMLVIGAILVVCQLSGTFWLWHESRDQIRYLVQGALDNHHYNNHLRREIHQALTSLIVPGLIMVTLTLLFCYQAIKLITRPLDRLQRELKSRDAENLTPLAPRGQVIEVTAVVGALNQLVARLSAMLENERMFSRDVASALQMPLEEIQGLLEAQARQGTTGIEPLLARLEQMRERVEQLLQLSRVGQNFAAGNYQRVMLHCDVVTPLWEELETMLSRRQQRLVLNLADDVAVRGDATLLRVVLRNLVENAHRYSPQGSTITLSITGSPLPQLSVEDEGPGINESQREKLSQAFVRMDSRYGGVGLGLSIVSRIAQLHQGRLLLNNRTPQPGLLARVVLSPSDDLVRFNIGQRPQ
jgi:two-component system sensor histidine kinase BasS